MGAEYGGVAGRLQAAGPEGGSMSKWKLWAASVLGVLALVVVLQNTEDVQTEILWISLTMPRFLLLLITLVIGVVIGAFTAERLRK